MIIYLGLPSPAGSSDLPEGRRAALCLLLVLLRMGFTYAPPVTRRAVVSCTALPTLPAETGGIFLLHYPWSRLHRTLSGILPCEARTFLVCCQPRSFVLLIFLYSTIFSSICKIYFRPAIAVRNKLLNFYAYKVTSLNPLKLSGIITI